MASSVDDAMVRAEPQPERVHEEHRAEQPTRGERDPPLVPRRVLLRLAQVRLVPRRRVGLRVELGATTRAAPTLSVATAPAFSYAGLACCNSVVALIKPQVASPSRGTPARITSESFQEK